jgi:hypothetical protein
MADASFSDLEGPRYLQVNYNPEHNEILIVGNRSSLHYLQGAIKVLVESGVHSSHHHFDRAAGNMDGNVESMIISLVLIPPEAE